MSIDRFFEKQYHESNYNCAHFTAEVWEAVTGQDIQNPLWGFFLPPSKRHATTEIRRAFIRIKEPVDPCIVLMRGGPETQHIGVFIGGRVLHIKESGVEYQPLEVATLGFKNFRFYDVK